MKREVVIVTAFQDIGRDQWQGSINGEVIPSYIKRDTSTYVERFERLARLNNRIILFCDEEYFYLSEKYSNVTTVSLNRVLDYDYQITLNNIKLVQQRVEFINFVDKKSSPEYWSPEYVMINMLKSKFVSESLSMNIINPNDTVAWIDFGYCREDSDAPLGKTFKFDDQDRINLFTNGNISHYAMHNKPIFDLIKTGEVLIQGSHVIAPATEFVLLYDIMFISLCKLLNMGLVDDDQTLLLMSYRHYSNKYIINQNSSTDWFNIIRNNCE